MVKGNRSRTPSDAKDGKNLHQLANDLSDGQQSSALLQGSTVMPATGVAADYIEEGGSCAGVSNSQRIRNSGDHDGGSPRASPRNPASPRNNFGNESRSSSPGRKPDLKSSGKTPGWSPEESPEDSPEGSSAEEDNEGLINIGGLVLQTTPDGAGTRLISGQDAATPSQTPDNVTPSSLPKPESGDKVVSPDTKAPTPNATSPSGASPSSAGSSRTQEARPTFEAKQDVPIPANMASVQSNQTDQTSNQFETASSVATSTLTLPKDTTKFATIRAVDTDTHTAIFGREHMIRPEDITTTSAAQEKHLKAFQEGCQDWLKYQHVVQDSEELENCEKFLLGIVEHVKKNVAEGSTFEETLANITEKKWEDYGKLMRKEMKFTPAKPMLVKAYATLRNTGSIPVCNTFEQKGKKKNIRSNSGVVVITVVTSPGTFSCPHDCYYCPDEPGQPRSYLSTEPAVARANQNDFDPVRQFYDRASTLAKQGHVVDKIEIIVLGGTWSAYPRDYQESFCRDLFYAANTFTNEGAIRGGETLQSALQQRERLSIAEEQYVNETAECKIIGLTLETRPDHINPGEVRRLRMLGCTRVQIGVQHTDNQILDAINRGHSVEKAERAVHYLKSAGFKVDIHLMPDLPFSNPEKDWEMFRFVLNGSSLQADHWKVYPCEVTPFTTIEKWYEEGKYMPYTEEDPETLINLLCNVKANVHPWIRLNRVIRDIPEVSIIAGNQNTNLRQVIFSRLQQCGTSCKCIRCREVRDWPEPLSCLRVKIRRYRSSEGWEFFITVEGEDRGLGGGAEKRKYDKKQKLTKKEKKDMKNTKKTLKKTAEEGFFTKLGNMLGFSSSDTTPKYHPNDPRSRGEELPKQKLNIKNQTQSKKKQKEEANAALPIPELRLACEPDVATADEAGKYSYNGVQYEYHNYEDADKYVKTDLKEGQETDNGTLYGLLRLRLSDDPTAAGRMFPELNLTALIRELHVYGTVKPVYRKKEETKEETKKEQEIVLDHEVELGNADEFWEDELGGDKIDLNNFRKPESFYSSSYSSNAGAYQQHDPQHGGIGKLLMHTAERIADMHNWPKIAVISGVGVRNYYRKLGYRRRGEGRYLIKDLKDIAQILHLEDGVGSEDEDTEFVAQPDGNATTNTVDKAHSIAAMIQKTEVNRHLYPFENRNCDMKSVKNELKPTSSPDVKKMKPFKHLEVSMMKWQQWGPLAAEAEQSPVKKVLENAKRRIENAKESADTAVDSAVESIRAMSPATKAILLAGATAAVAGTCFYLMKNKNRS